VGSPTGALRARASASASKARHSISFRRVACRASSRVAGRRAGGGGESRCGIGQPVVHAAADSAHTHAVAHFDGERSGLASGYRGGFHACRDLRACFASARDCTATRSCIAAASCICAKTSTSPNAVGRQLTDLSAVASGQAGCDGVSALYQDGKVTQPVVGGEQAANRAQCDHHRRGP
jgi:hypothetical protein